MAVSPVGPIFVGGFEEFVVNEGGEDYTLLFLPDRMNAELQAARQQPVFYYVPEQVRLARKGDKGDFKFRHIHFVGVFDETNVGIAAGETQGGVLAFTITSRYPTAVLKKAEQQILAKFGGANDKYWGLRTSVAPSIRIAPITANVTAIANITPAADGTVPGEAAGALPGGSQPSGGAQPGGEPGNGIPAEPGAGGEGPRQRAVVYGARAWQPVPHGRDFRPGLAVNPWAWRLDGQGPGSITGGENAYAGVLGPLPSEIIWAGMHGTYSPLVVTQNLMLPMWSQLMRVKITGSWESVFRHFSAHANARYLWASADIKAEFNNLRKSGDIKVEVDIDGTMPGGQELEKAINQRIDMIVQQFTEAAKKVIFEAPTPQVPPAQAPSGGLFSSIFGGGGLALRFRRDETQLNLRYEETRYFRYLQPHTISSSLEGFYNEIKNDPSAEQKYFLRLVLGQLGRKVMRLVKPVVNWPDKAQASAGHPVAFLSAQIGYPTKEGSLDWKAQSFQKSDAADTTFRPVFVRWMDNEVTRPPAGWTPDMTYVKRKVHLLEPPSPNEYPFTRIQVEQNVIELDPPTGALSNDNILEVRADEAGMLEVGPIALNAVLSSAAEVVEVEMRAKGRRVDGTDRASQVVRLRWTFADQDEPRFWRVFTGQPDFKPEYQYRVHVTVKGTIFSKGEAWSGPWEEAVSNGALMVSVPPPDGPGVVKRSLTPREMFSDAPVRAADSFAVEPVTEPIQPVAPGPPGAEPELVPSPTPSAEPVVAGTGSGAPGAPAERFKGQPPPPPPHVTVRTPAGPSYEPMPVGRAKEASYRPVPVHAGASRGSSDPNGWTELPAGGGRAERQAPPKRMKGSRATPKAEEDPGGWMEVPTDREPT